MQNFLSMTNNFFLSLFIYNIEVKLNDILYSVWAIEKSMTFHYKFLNYPTCNAYRFSKLLVKIWENINCRI